VRKEGVDIRTSGDFVMGVRKTQKLRVLTTVARRRAYSPEGYSISPHPEHNSEGSPHRAQDARRAQKNHRLTGVEPLANQGVVRHRVERLGEDGGGSQGTVDKGTGINVLACLLHCI